MIIKKKLLLFTGVAFALATLGGCLQLESENVCDMTPDGSVWLTVARLVWAEQKFFGLHGRYGQLVEMTNLIDGLPPDVTGGRMGSYSITIDLPKEGFVLHANPDPVRRHRALPSFYGDQTGRITFDRSGKPAGPDSERMYGK